ncbi:MAG: hypothetical protein V4638_07330 [Bacteroidota bacterium]
MKEEKAIVQRPKITRRVRNLVLGARQPDPLTLVVFLMNLFFGCINLFWSLLSYLILAKKSLITEIKDIDIDAIIAKRGQELGFMGDDFLHRLMTTQAIGIVVWSIFLLGVLMLFRMNRNFAFILLGTLFFYIGMLVFYISYGYFKSDVTLFDKIGFIVIFTSSTVHYFLLRKEQTGGTMNFFHEEEAIE